MTVGAPEPQNKLEESVLDSRGAWQTAAGQLKELAPVRGLLMTWSDQHRNAYFGASRYPGVFLESMVLAQYLWNCDF